MGLISHPWCGFENCFQNSRMTKIETGTVGFIDWGILFSSLHRLLIPFSKHNLVNGFYLFQNLFIFFSLFKLNKRMRNRMEKRCGAARGRSFFLFIYFNSIPTRENFSVGLHQMPLKVLNKWYSIFFFFRKRILFLKNSTLVSWLWMSTLNWYW